MRWLGTHHKLKGKRRETLEPICGYFHNSASRMAYDVYLAHGLPIATGVIEGACRFMVKDRMERSGMRWVMTGARAMLDQRCTYLSGFAEEFIAFRIQPESRRLYPGSAFNDPDCRLPLAAQQAQRTGCTQPELGERAGRRDGATVGRELKGSCTGLVLEPDRVVVDGIALVAGQNPCDRVAITAINAAANLAVASLATDGAHLDRWKARNRGHPRSLHAAIGSFVTVRGYDVRINTEPERSEAIRREAGGVVERDAHPQNVGVESRHRQRLTARPQASYAGQLPLKERELVLDRSAAVLRIGNGTSKTPFHVPLGDSIFSPVRPAPGLGKHGARPAARRRAYPRPLREWLGGIPDALAYGLRCFGTQRPLCHRGRKPAPYTYRQPTGFAPLSMPVGRDRDGPAREADLS